MSFFSEIKRRKVFQVAAVYAVVAWLLVQVVATVEAPLSLPTWFATVVIVALAAGFPIAVILAWAFDLAPDGVVRDEGNSLSPRSSGGRIEYALIGLLIIAMSWVLYRVEFIPSTATADVEAGEDQHEVLQNSIAVIPFDNMSANPEDAYFAAGMHDEILNQLAKLKNLNVIARTSVMQYAGAARPITEIARELNVATIMEGSVSYAEGRVAIRAQLIDAETGVHLWSESYNREFSNVFDIQSDIAMNVANALEAEFSLEEQEAIEKQPTDSPVAYALYLKAVAEIVAGGVGSSWETELDQALQLDPNFALAHATKAYFTAYIAFEWPPEVEEAVTTSSNRALRLDPTLGLAHAALAYMHQAKWHLREAQQSFEQALALSPNNAVILDAYSRFHRNIGDYKEAVRLGRRAAQLDPGNAGIWYQLGLTERYAGEYDAAYLSMQTGLSLAQTSPQFHYQAAAIEISRGNPEEALRSLQTSEALLSTPIGWRLGQIAFAYAQLDRPDDVRRIFEQLEAVHRETPVDDAVWAMAYIALGEHDRALPLLRAAIDVQVPNVFALAEIKANAYHDPVLDEPRFQELRDQIGAF